MKRIIIQRSIVRFLRFCRGAYAVFRSLHKEVTIGHLASYIADKQLRKSAVVGVMVLFGTPFGIMAQVDEDREVHTLPEVKIVLSADTSMALSEPAAVFTATQIQQSSVKTIGELLQLLPGVDIRTRGGDDVQGDITMRGGTFDQMAILLNGVNITDVQTGHHNLDLPIDLMMVERVELLTPSQALSRGVVAYCGAVNVVVHEQYRDRFLAQISGGSYGMLKYSMLATQTSNAWSTTLAANYNRSDGYMRNTDYNYGNLFFQALRHAQNHDWHIQVGGQSKAFGSNAFYSTKYPDQYEATKTLLASAMYIYHTDHLRIEATLYDRLHRDRFELFRDNFVIAPEWYSGHNHHLSDNIGLRTRIIQRLAHGEVYVGADAHSDMIWSNVLGIADTTLSSPYTKYGSRNNLSLFSGYHLTTSHLLFEADVLGAYNSAFGLDYAFEMSIEYLIDRHLRVYGEMGRNFRLPTFTDLYYQGAQQISNPDLKSENNISLEGGIKVDFSPIRCSGSFFYRNGNNVIDWVRASSDEKWHSMNHTSVRTFGIESSLLCNLSSQLSLMGSYSYCHTDKDAGSLQSLYSLEYLRYKADMSISYSPLDVLRLKANVGYKNRVGEYDNGDGIMTPYGDVLTIDAAVEYKLRNITLFVEAYNLTNRQYVDYVGVPQQGRTLLVGLRMDTDKMTE